MCSGVPCACVSAFFRVLSSERSDLVCSSYTMLPNATSPVHAHIAPSSCEAELLEYLGQMARLWFEAIGCSGTRLLLNCLGFRCKMYQIQNNAFLLLLVLLHYRILPRLTTFCVGMLLVDAVSVCLPELHVFLRLLCCVRKTRQDCKGDEDSDSEHPHAGTHVVGVFDFSRPAISKHRYHPPARDTRVFYDSLPYTTIVDANTNLAGTCVHMLSCSDQNKQIKTL